MKNIYFVNGVKIQENSDGSLIIFLSTGEKINIDSGGKIIEEGGNILTPVTIKYPFQYFDFIGEKERREVQNHFLKRSSSQKNEYASRFYNVLFNAISAVKYDYYIANRCASVNSTGGIYYAKDAKVAMGYSKKDWLEMANAFWPEYNSDIATLYEYFIWIAYQIIEKRWALDTLCTENRMTESDIFLCTRKLVRHKDELIRCGYNYDITRSPGRIPLKITYGAIKEFATPYPYQYTGIIVLRK